MPADELLELRLVVERGAVELEDERLGGPRRSRRARRRCQARARAGPGGGARPRTGARSESSTSARASASAWRTRSPTSRRCSASTRAIASSPLTAGPFPLCSIRSSRSSRARSSSFSRVSALSRADELRRGSCSHQSIPIERAVSADAMRRRSFRVRSSMSRSCTVTSPAITTPLSSTRSRMSASEACCSDGGAAYLMLSGCVARESSLLASSLLRVGLVARVAADAFRLDQVAVAVEQRLVASEHARRVGNARRARAARASRPNRRRSRRAARWPIRTRPASRTTPRPAPGRGVPLRGETFSRSHTDVRGALLRARRSSARHLAAI